MRRSIVVVGGGIAGLSAAWHLARRARVRVTLLEREPLLCSHASGHNAAIFRPLEADGCLTMLARDSSSLFDELLPTVPLVARSGLVLLHASGDALEPTRRSALEHGVACERLPARRLSELLKDLTLATELHALYAPSGGVIDIHALAAVLAGACRDLGVELRTRSGVAELLADGGRVVGVRTSASDVLRADDVVLAAGAWTAALGASVDCPLALTPMRRHLALLEPGRALSVALPAVWRLDDEVYFRREGARVLASPCDETAWSVGPAQADVEALAPLASKLGKIDRALGEARVVRTWACLRTFAPDRRPVVGSDSRLAGLHWLTALGGFGMTAGLAAGGVLARALLHERHQPELSPARRCVAAPEAVGNAT